MKLKNLKTLFLIDFYILIIIGLYLLLTIELTEDSKIFDYINPEIFKDYLVDNYFQKYVEEFQNNNLVLSTANFCNAYGLFEEKISCVYTLMKRNFQYEELRILNPQIIYEPKKVLVEGKGVCRDFAVTFCAIANNLSDVGCKFILIGNHVIAFAYKKSSPSMFFLADQNIIRR